jgi:hypothetical protein
VNILGAIFLGSSGSDQAFSGEINMPSMGVLTSDWKQYTLNLPNFEREPSDNETLRIRAGGEFYIDNIVLTETNSDLYLIKDSWQTAKSCDEPVIGAQLGCESYKDKDGKAWYAKSFTKICYDFAVGCEAMIDTQNSEVPYELEYENSSLDLRDDVVIPMDQLIYMVYDGKKSCQQLGCVSLGLMSVDSSMAKINFTTKNVVIDPNNFGNQNSPLCKSEAVGCEEFETVGEKSTGTTYFKDPGSFVCEYRAVGGNYGWYKVGSKEACPGTNLSKGVTGAPQTIYNGYCFGAPSESCGRDEDCNSAGPCMSYGYCSNEPIKICREDGDCVGSAPCISNKHCIGGMAKNNGTEDNTCLQNSGASGCMDYSTGKDGGSCSSWVALCPEEMNTCSEYQDPNTPEGCEKESVNFEYIVNPIDPTKAKIPYCDFYYYKTDVVETCTSIDPKVGCLGFHQTDGGENIYYGVPRCDGKPEIRCESDSDCLCETTAPDCPTGNYGNCAYIPQESIQIFQQPSQPYNPTFIY